MKKLIKLSELHYVVVDDSEIKSKDKFYDFTLKFINEAWLDFGKHATCKKITHSTQPNKGMENVTFISLSEVEEAINGYSVEKMAEKILTSHKDYKSEGFSDYQNGRLNGIIEGFKAHQELVKDKLFTIDDLVSFEEWLRKKFGSVKPFQEAQIRLKLSPKEVVEYYYNSKYQTEWDITIDDQGKIKLL